MLLNTLPFEAGKFYLLIIRSAVEIHTAKAGSRNATTIRSPAKHREIWPQRIGDPVLSSIWKIVARVKHVGALADPQDALASGATTTTAASGTIAGTATLTVGTSAGAALKTGRTAKALHSLTEGSLYCVVALTLNQRFVLIAGSFSQLVGYGA